MAQAYDTVVLSPGTHDMKNACSGRHHTHLTLKEEHRVESQRTKLSGTKPKLVSFTVDHGGIVIRSGPTAQKYLEHGVECAISMNFVLTYQGVPCDMGAMEHWAKLDRKLETSGWKEKKREHGEKSVLERQAKNDKCGIWKPAAPSLVNHKISR